MLLIVALGVLRESVILICRVTYDVTPWRIRKHLYTCVFSWYILSIHSTTTLSTINTVICPIQSLGMLHKAQKRSNALLVQPEMDSVNILMHILVSCESRTWEIASLQSSTKVQSSTEIQVVVGAAVADVLGGFGKFTGKPTCCCWEGRGSTWHRSQGLSWMGAPTIRSPSSFPEMPEKMSASGKRKGKRTNYFWK